MKLEIEFNLPDKAAQETFHRFMAENVIMKVTLEAQSGETVNIELKQKTSTLVKFPSKGKGN